MRLVLIAAMDRQHAIGRDNALPWHLPADLRRFKALTTGHPILMGRKTAESIGRALPGRRNLVLTRRDVAPFAGQEVVDSLDAACRAAAPAPALMVIGGGEVYALALSQAQRLHLTLVDTVIERADAHFPAFDPRQWRETARSANPSDAQHGFAFEFVDYERIR